MSLSECTPLLVHPRHRMKFILHGAELFNEEHFFEAHEVWEDLWKLESGNERIVIQGMIQAAAHFVHINKKNWSAAHSLGIAAIDKLTVPLPKQSQYHDIELEPVISALSYNIRILHDANATHADRLILQHDTFLFPKIFDLKDYKTTSIE